MSTAADLIEAQNLLVFAIRRREREAVRRVLAGVAHQRCGPREDDVVSAYLFRLHNWLADWVLTPLAVTCLWLIRQRRRHPVAYWSVLLAYAAVVGAWLVR